MVCVGASLRQVATAAAAAAVLHRRTCRRGAERIGLALRGQSAGRGLRHAAVIGCLPDLGQVRSALDIEGLRGGGEARELSA